ncbi:hypothetical protein [Streptomyces sp. NBC_00151]|uniref:hypothetical protein n=1 Tax=Streptomyces sp. NBC_00151 TaxID=2975669 RepID=UPI002DDA703C|nr:hypothetical protein [Streptomyces sp. NBC_00151]WRZ37337.1 hypothetical protein OG915_04255 [Streptomyces sp. NBC_00151]
MLVPSQRAPGRLGADLAELVPGGEVLEHAGVFGVLGGGDPLGEPPLEQQESAVEVRQDTAVHEQVAQVGGGPPVRQGLDGGVCEQHCSGGEVSQQGRDLRVAEPDQPTLRTVQSHQELVQRNQLRVGLDSL